MRGLVGSMLVLTLTFPPKLVEVSTPFPTTMVPGEQRFFAEATILKDLGFSLQGVYEHAAHESGNFTSRLTQHNNPFGLKTPTSIPWDGEVIRLPDGNFCGFPTMAEAFTHYGTYVIPKAHPEAFAVRHDPEAYFVALQQGNLYATDKKYVEKLHRRYEELKPRYAAMVALYRLERG